MKLIKTLNQTLSLSTTQNGFTYETIKYHEYFKLYSFSCFFYLLAGLIRIKQKAYVDGINLIIQSFLSYKSDVLTLGLSSKWHIVDRYFAFLISIYHFYVIDSVYKIVINTVLFFTALDYLESSRNDYVNNSSNFLIEHTKWHFVSVIMALFS
jgi:hypothetical protein